VRGGGIIELRCDSATPRQMLEAMDFAHLPVIVTVRPKWEGGFCEKGDEYRVGLWEAAMEAGAEYVDVELVGWEKNKELRDRVCEAAEKHGTKIILSNHSFDGRPKDLDARLARLRRVKQADVLKIAWKAESVIDAVDALMLGAKLQKEDGRPAVVLAMGEEGLISRLLAAKFGAPWAFAALAEGAESAPGQPSVADLRDIYRWDAHKEDMQVFGVAGWPVGHSLSPHIHNAGFGAINRSGVYVPLAIKAEYAAFAAAVDALRAATNIRGISVTIPHKENAFRYVSEKSGLIDALSKRIGVINTMEWTKDGVVGFNSDYAGALDALASAWTGNRTDLDGKRVVVLGAGGAARAIVAGLVEHGASVVIYNRTLEKAQALAADFGASSRGLTPPTGGEAATHGRVSAQPWEKLSEATCDAYINCTPLGMFPHVDASPVDFDPAWTAETVVFDTVYNPVMTKLLKLAQRKGAKIVPGTEMFVRQAAVQFRAFTEREAPIEVFRAALTQALGSA